MAKTITHQDNDETKPALFGEKDHLEISKSKTFTQMVCELLTEREPTEAETKLLDLIMNLSIDHGSNSPSAVATINASKEGKTMGESVGTGLFEIGDRHGGAGGPLMSILYDIKDTQSRHPEEPASSGSKRIVEEYLKEGKRLPGLGHRVYKQSLPSNDGKEKEADPRAELILSTALEQGIGAEYISILKELRNELHKQSGKILTINIDGAIAAVLCGFGLKPEVGIAVFIVARTPGLIGQYLNNS